MLDPTLHLLGGVTTPLVELAVGFSLKDGVTRIGAVAATVALRLVATGALGALVAVVLVPGLGLGPLYSKAAMIPFLLPPPFVIPVFRTKGEDASSISGTLSLHTIASLVAIVVFVSFSP